MTIALQNTIAASLGVQQLTSAFSPAFSHLRILRNLIIPMPEGSPVRTAQIDAVLVCETGIYLFEIKAWRNAFVYRKKSGQAPPRWFLRLQGCTRAREVKDPAWQGGRKTTQLRSLLADELRLQYFVLLPCEGVELEGVMPAAVITQQDLPYIARLVRNNGRTARTYPLLDAEAIDRTAQRLLDIQGGLSVEDHVQNCRERSEQISVRWNIAGANNAMSGIGLQ
ncbi:nuclease-related domain-containing protein [Variovorax sp. OV700]|uniref:nuclease-related domain-containing protein n=1 Tax=Variovorax sp. OV700 TaxID=1882826 RepID=UPI00087FD54B|nr:nuclease-related domain-containing protein [Variovorax sp. OV700]SDJ67208.1 Nuclease-related domain-containing protein [Variovorax sp. OV700]